MPERVTFDVEDRGRDSTLPPWTILVYPINPVKASTRPAWIATITSQGLTMEAGGITDHITWERIVATAREQGALL